MDDLNSKLNKASENLARKRKITAQLNDLYNQKSELDDRELTLRDQLQNEKADVERLEKGGLRIFFIDLIGALPKKLDRERADVISAAAKYDAVVKQLAAVESELLKLESENKLLFDSENEYNNLFKEKSELLQNDNSPLSDELRDIDKQINNITAQLIEITEAETVGQQVLTQFDNIESELNSAEGWGTWDLFGGGLITDIIKHDHIDSAQSGIDKLQDTLRRFRTELADVQLDSDLRVGIEGFTRFADFFFDDIFSSFAVLDSIRDSQSSIMETRLKVEKVQSQLRQRRGELDFDKKKLTDKRAELIERA
jgi:hypothetical protein